MQGLNKAYLIGTVGRDPEKQTDVRSTKAVKLSLATPHAQKVDGAWVDTPDWHRLTFTGSDADYVLSRVCKGDTMAVECAIRPSQWTDKDGKTHHEVNLVVDRVLWHNTKGAR